MIDAFVVATNIFQPIIDVFEQILIWLHSIIGSWGFAIIGLTIIIRTLMLPLAVVQYRSMKNMSALAPMIKELKEKYPDDQQKQMTAQRELMAEAGVNPLAGCLPILVQLPVFISLFYMLRTDLKADICGLQVGPLHTKQQVLETACNSVVPGSGKFFFIPDLTAPAHSTVLIGLLILYVGSQLLSTLLMPSTVQGFQRNIMYLLPFIFVPFILGFPAGLLVYWITTNFYTVIQQVALRRIFGAPGANTPVTDETPVGMIEGAIVEAAELRATLATSERPAKRKRTGKRK